MGYFENLAESSLKTGKHGETLYSRYGVFTKPYIVPPERRDDVKKFLVRYMQIAISVGTLCGIVLKLKGLPILLPIMVWYEVVSRKKVQGLARSDEKMKWGDSYDNTSKNFGLGFLWFGLISSALFVVGGLFLAQTGRFWLGWGGAGFFALVGLAYVRMLVTKYRARKAGLRIP